MYRLPCIRPRFLTRQFSIGHADWGVCWPKPDYGPMDVMRSDLMNGTKVASAKPLGSQIGACTIMYQVCKTIWESEVEFLLDVQNIHESLLNLILALHYLNKV